MQNGRRDRVDSVCVEPNRSLAAAMGANSDGRIGVVNGFDASWEPVHSRPAFKIASCRNTNRFPGSSSVVSDFSLLKMDQSTYRISLASVSAEGQFHARQWCEFTDAVVKIDGKMFLCEELSASSEDERNWEDGSNLLHC